MGKTKIAKVGYLLGKLEFGDETMADKRLNIQDLLAPLGARLNTNIQFLGENVMKTKLRICMKRAILSFKEFHVHLFQGDLHYV